MAAFFEETVTHVHHWTDRLFSFRTTRDPGFRFENGQFAMIGLVVDGKPLLRAYSMASPNHDEELEFFSIKVPDGPLTSRLQGIVPGDTVLIGRKATGTLVQDSLLDGRNLYLVSTGTGFAPFASIIRDFAIYERYEKVIAIHGCRQVSELGYSQHVVSRVRDDEYLSEVAAGRLVYHPTVTREAFGNTGRVTDGLADGSIPAKAGLGLLDPAVDRVMICGSEAMLKDMVVMMKQRGFAEGSSSSAGHYVIEKAFVEK
ncbi:MAG: ferredoxin--NADP reductase [Bosea sp.]|jgi:ferredoxin--NADP+ reductase|nr:ferredoxin--NADP reductase [Bosea sp. (in: a-proteobacteria)]